MKLPQITLASIQRDWTFVIAGIGVIVAQGVVPEGVARWVSIGISAVTAGFAAMSKPAPSIADVTSAVKKGS